MNNEKKKIWKQVIFTVITFSCICFIFSRSLVPGQKSGQESSKILELLNTFANFFGFDNLFTHNFVRKCAHFTEFAVLGMLAFNMYSTYKIKFKLIVSFTATTYIVTAVIDEIIQYFVPERACQFLDVLIDSAGGTFGLIICIVFYVILNRIRKKSDL